MGNSEKKIAVIGWGSLIWCPRSLRIQSGWHRDGPRLPVEFSRISRDQRLTLIIVNSDDVEPQPTLWALSEPPDIESAVPDIESAIESAVENLAKREGIKDEVKKERWIGRWPRQDNQDPYAEEETIAAWCKKHPLDGAVWTSLPPKDKRGRERKMTADEAVDYLKSLRGDCLKRAKEYIQLTPKQIDTNVRKRVRSELEWEDLPLAKFLFEGSG